MDREEEEGRRLVFRFLVVWGMVFLCFESVIIGDGIFWVWDIGGLSCL